MTKQKHTLREALELKANTLLDAYLATTKAQVPPTFRKGLSFTATPKVDDADAKQAASGGGDSKSNKSKEAQPENAALKPEESKDEEAEGKTHEDVASEEAKPKQPRQPQQKPNVSSILSRTVTTSIAFVD